MLEVIFVDLFGLLSTVPSINVDCGIGVIDLVYILYIIYVISSSIRPASLNHTGQCQKTGAERSWIWMWC